MKLDIFINKSPELFFITALVIYFSLPFLINRLVKDDLFKLVKWVTYALVIYLLTDIIILLLQYKFTGQISLKVVNESLFVAGPALCVGPAVC